MSDDTAERVMIGEALGGGVRLAGSAVSAAKVAASIVAVRSRGGSLAVLVHAASVKPMNIARQRNDFDLMGYMVSRLCGFAFLYSLKA